MLFNNRLKHFIPSVIFCPELRNDRTLNRNSKMKEKMSFQVLKDREVSINEVDRIIP